MMQRKTKDGDEDEELRTAFQLFDTNGDNFVSESELCQGLQSLGENLSKQDVKAMIAMVDRDNDGKIRYNILVTIIKLLFSCFFCFLFEGTIVTIHLPLAWMNS